MNHYIILNTNIYHSPFGSPLRKYNFTDMNVGFNGKRMDNELSVEGGHLDFGARIYDSRVGRFLSKDPLTNNFPSLSAYTYAADNPIILTDYDGKGPRYYEIAQAFVRRLEKLGFTQGKGDGTFRRIVTENQVAITIQLNIDGKDIQEKFVFNEQSNDDEDAELLRSIGVDFRESVIASEPSYWKRLEIKTLQLEDKVKSSPLEGLKLTAQFWGTVLTFGEGAALLKGGGTLLEYIIALADLGLTANSLTGTILAENETVIERLGIKNETLEYLEAGVSIASFAEGVYSLTKTAIKKPNISGEEYKLALIMMAELQSITKIVDIVKSKQEVKSASQKSKSSTNTGKSVREKSSGDKGKVGSGRTRARF